MRTKDKIKAAALAGLPSEEQWQAAHFGDRYNPAASGLIQVLDQALDAEDGEKLFPATKEKFNELKAHYHKKAWQRFSQHYRKSRATGDGNFFRQLAAMIEGWNSPVDPVQASIARIIHLSGQREKPLPTASEVVKILASDGLETNRQTVHRIFRYFGKIPGKGQIGRPRKPRK